MILSIRNMNQQDKSLICLKKIICIQTMSVAYVIHYIDGTKPKQLD